MADILHDLWIRSTPTEVYEMVSTPKGLDRWWSLRSDGVPAVGETYELFFGPEWDWRAIVTRADVGRFFELEFTAADADWMGSRVGFEVEKDGESTCLRFQHVGWPTANEHFRRSSYCWAMYLRVLKRYLESGIEVPYQDRTNI